MCGLSVFVPFSFFKFHKILSIQSADIILAYSTFILSITLEHLVEVYFTGPSHWANCWEGNRQEGQGSPGARKEAAGADIFISLKRQEETNQPYVFFSVQI